MKTTLAGLAGILALSACTGGVPGFSAEQCANAQKAIEMANAAIVAYPDQTRVPAFLYAALAIAQAELPAFCAAPETVAIPEVVAK